MAVEITPELAFSGTGFFFCAGIDVIVPGAGGNTFPSKDVLAKQSNVWWLLRPQRQHCVPDSFFLSINDWFIPYNAACIEGQCLLGFGFSVSFSCRLVLLRGRLLPISFSLGLFFTFNLCVAAGMEDLSRFLALYLL